MASGVSCQVHQPCEQPLNLSAQGGLSALQKFLRLVFFVVRSRGFAGIIFTLCGINSQPEKQRKTPHEDHVRQSYSCTIYLFTHRSYFLPLLVRDLLCWPKIRFPPWLGIYGSAALTVMKESQPPIPDRTSSCLWLASVQAVAPRPNTSSGHLQGRAVVFLPLE